MTFGVCVRYRAFIFCVCVCVNAYVYTHTHTPVHACTHISAGVHAHTHTHVARFLHVTHDVSSRPPRTCAVSSRPASPVLATAPAGPGRRPACSTASVLPRSSGSWEGAAETEPRGTVSRGSRAHGGHVPKRGDQASFGFQDLFSVENVLLLFK